MGGGHHHQHHHHHQGEDGHQRAESSAMGRKRKKAQTTVPTQDGAGDEDGEAKKMREQVRVRSTSSFLLKREVVLTLLSSAPTERVHQLPKGSSIILLPPPSPKAFRSI